MSWQHALAFGALVGLFAPYGAQAQSPDRFAGFYGGIEGGAFSYNTQITFDGVDDPAGRGGAGYGAFLGYNHTREKWLVGVELLFTLASVPDPYTFDPAAAGFADLDLRRDAIAGLEVRAGYLISQAILLYGNAGYSANKQSVRIDGVPLDQFAGGAAAKTFGAFQSSAGVEVAPRPDLGVRVTFRTVAGHDLHAGDFGAIATDASLTRFDVEPVLQQFLIGLIFRF